MDVFNFPWTFPCIYSTSILPREESWDLALPEVDFLAANAGSLALDGAGLVWEYKVVFFTKVAC